MKTFYIKYIKPVLKFLRIIDAQGDLSITNLLIILFAHKFANTPMETFNIESFVPVLGAMGMYFGKKVVDKPVTKIDPAITDEIVGKLKTFANIESEN